MLISAKSGLFKVPISGHSLLALTLERVLAQVDADADAVLAQMRFLYGQGDGDFVIAPDTNALLFRPEIEAWSFPDIDRFTIVLLPTIVSELDELKVFGRTESAREKAELLTRKIKEYMRRGRITEGVNIVTNKIQLRAVAVEPDMSQMPTWLKASVNDDRIIASVIELMRKHPNCRVALVTRDVGMAIKAEYAAILCVSAPSV